MKTILVPVSGGKDSQVVLSLALAQSKLTGQPVVCVHQNTGYDHPDTYHHIKVMELFYGVTVEHTVSKHGDMFGFLKKAQYFPNSAARGCTSELKQFPFAAWLTTHKLIKIHKAWDIAAFLKEGDATKDLPENPDDECWWCSI